MISRRLIAPAAVAVAVVAGGVAGAMIGVPALSGASESSTTTTPVTKPHLGLGPRFGKFGRLGGGGGELAAAAQALHLTTEQLLQKLSDGTTTIADVAQQQNVPLDDVVNAMARADRQRIEDFVHNPLPKFPRLPAAGVAPGGGLGFGRAFVGPLGLDAAANALHITTQQLLNDLRNGKTIADVAQGKGVGVNTVIGAMVANANARIDQAQQHGRISPSQVEAAKAKIKDAITQFVNNGMPKLPWGGFGKGGHLGASYTPSLSPA